MKFVIGLLKGVYKYCKEIVYIVGVMFFFIIVANGIAQQPFGLWSGNNVEHVYDLSKLTMGTTPYFMQVVCWIFIIGFFVEIIYGLIKWIKSRQEKKINVGLENNIDIESVYGKPKENIFVSIIKWIIKN